MGAWQLWLVGGPRVPHRQTPGATDPLRAKILPKPRPAPKLDLDEKTTWLQTWISGTYESSAICLRGCPISKAVIYESRLAPIEEGAHLRNKLLVLQNHKTAVSLPLNQGLTTAHHLTSAKVFAKWSGFWKIDKTIGNVMVSLHITLSHQQKQRAFPITQYWHCR